MNNRYVWAKQTFAAPLEMTALPQQRGDYPGRADTVAGTRESRPRHFHSMHTCMQRFYSPFLPPRLQIRDVSPVHIFRQIKRWGRVPAGPSPCPHSPVHRYPLFKAGETPGDQHPAQLPSEKKTNLVAAYTRES